MDDSSRESGTRAKDPKWNIVSTFSELEEKHDGNKNEGTFLEIEMSGQWLWCIILFLFGCLFVLGFSYVLYVKIQIPNPFHIINIAK